MINENIITKLSEVAENLDRHKLYAHADTVTRVMSETKQFIKTAQAANPLFPGTQNLFQTPQAPVTPAAPQAPVQPVDQVVQNLVNSGKTMLDQLNLGQPVNDIRRTVLGIRQSYPTYEKAVQRALQVPTPVNIQYVKQGLESAVNIVNNFIASPQMQASAVFYRNDRAQELKTLENYVANLRQFMLQLDSVTPTATPPAQNQANPAATQNQTQTPAQSAQAQQAAVNPVAAWQRFLNIPADGVLGPQTKQATMNFQRQFGIAADGIPGPVTHAVARQLRGFTGPVPVPG